MFVSGGITVYTHTHTCVYTWAVNYGAEQETNSEIPLMQVTQDLTGARPYR